MKMVHVEAMISRYQSMEQQAMKGSPEQWAYRKIIQALQSDDSKAALEAWVQHAHEAVARHDLQDWNYREGYRGYYARQIELIEFALRESSFYSIETELCDMPDGWRLLVKVRVEENYGHYSVWQRIAGSFNVKPSENEVNTSYFEAMKRILASRTVKEKEEESV